MGVWEVEPELIAAIDKMLATMAVISAFALAPMLPYADPTAIASGGCLAAVGFGARFIGQQLPPGWSIASAFAGFAFFAWASWYVIPAAQTADRAARSNARRCLAIQRDMLSARPRRSDGADLFQALGCRPQGVGSVYAPLKDNKHD